MRRLRVVCLALLPLAACLHAQDAPGGSTQRVDRKFQAAVAQYESGRFPEAAAALESLLREVPESFEVHELLGLVYSAQSEDAKAAEHLEKAVRLKPDSAAARTNLGTNLARREKPALAEEQFKKALELESQNYDANHNLGELYVRARKVAAATPYPQQPQRTHLGSDD